MKWKLGRCSNCFKTLPCWPCSLIKTTLARILQDFSCTHYKVCKKLLGDLFSLELLHFAIWTSCSTIAILFDGSALTLHLVKNRITDQISRQLMILTNFKDLKLLLQNLCNRHIRVVQQTIFKHPEHKVMDKKYLSFEALFLKNFTKNV